MRRLGILIVLVLEFAASGCGTPSVIQVSQPSALAWMAGYIIRELVAT